MQASNYRAIRFKHIASRLQVSTNRKMAGAKHFLSGEGQGEE